MLISIETHITCDFQGGVQRPYPHSGSSHGTVRPCVRLTCNSISFYILPKRDSSYCALLMYDLVHDCETVNGFCEQLSAYGNYA